MEKSIPLAISFPAISMVRMEVLEYWNTPVSWIIPVYRHSAVSLEIFSSSIRPNSTSQVALASGSTTFTSP